MKGALQIGLRKLGCLRLLMPGSGSGPAATLRDVLGEEAVAQAQHTCLNCLESAAAVFELDSTPAYSERRSEYCALLHRATRHLTSYLGGESDPPRPWCRGSSAAA